MTAKLAADIVFLSNTYSMGHFEVPKSLTKLPKTCMNIRQSFRKSKHTEICEPPFSDPWLAADDC